MVIRFYIKCSHHEIIQSAPDIKRSGQKGFWCPNLTLLKIANRSPSLEHLIQWVQKGCSFARQRELYWLVISEESGISWSKEWNSHGILPLRHHIHLNITHWFLIENYRWLAGFSYEFGKSVSWLELAILWPSVGRIFMY